MSLQTRQSIRQKVQRFAHERERVPAPDLGLVQLIPHCKPTSHVYLFESAENANKTDRLVTTEKDCVDANLLWLTAFIVPPLVLVPTILFLIFAFPIRKLTSGELIALICLAIWIAVGLLFCIPLFRSYCAHQMDRNAFHRADKQTLPWDPDKKNILHAMTEHRQIRRRWWGLRKPKRD